MRPLTPRHDEAARWKFATAGLLIVVVVLCVVNYFSMNDLAVYTTNTRGINTGNSEPSKLQLLEENKFVPATSGSETSGSRLTNSIATPNTSASQQDQSTSSEDSEHGDHTGVDTNADNTDHQHVGSEASATSEDSGNDVNDTGGDDSAQPIDPSEPIPTANTDSDADTHTNAHFVPFPADHDDSQLHIVFSAECNQAKRLLLQSLLQMSATKVGQQGPITAIIAGCNDEEKARLLQEPKFYYDFRIHFTPNFATNDEAVGMDGYSAFNKPFGLRHFLANATPPVKHDIIALIDIDFIFFRPLEVNTGRDVSQYYSGDRDTTTVNDTVANGIAVSQDWLSILLSQFYASDQRDKLESVCDSPHQPCLDVSEDEAREYYTGVGPPYIMTVHDFRLMIDDYCHFCVLAHNATDRWEAEMFAYSMAAANHGIRHTRLNNLGLTHPKSQDGGHQYWDFTDLGVNPCIDDGEVVPPVREPPVMIHHCELYGFAYPDREVLHLYWKHKVPGEVMECKTPAIKLPPLSEWDDLEAEYGQDPERLRRKKQEVWAECSLIKIMNHALRELKAELCPTGFNTYPDIELIW